MAAFAEPAAHVFLHRKINLLWCKSKIQQPQGSEFHHNRRAADHRHGVVNIHILGFQYLGYNTNIVFPPILCFVDGKFYINT